jgi:hypothetical protein
MQGPAAENVIAKGTGRREVGMMMARKRAGTSTHRTHDRRLPVKLQKYPSVTIPSKHPFVRAAEGLIMTYQILADRTSRARGRRVTANKVLLACLKLVMAPHSWSRAQCFLLEM